MKPSEIIANYWVDYFKSCIVGNLYDDNFERFRNYLIKRIEDEDDYKEAFSNGLFRIGILVGEPDEILDDALKICELPIKGFPFCLITYFDNGRCLLQKGDGFKYKELN